MDFYFLCVQPRSVQSAFVQALKLCGPEEDKIEGDERIELPVSVSRGHSSQLYARGGGFRSFKTIKPNGKVLTIYC